MASILDSMTEVERTAYRKTKLEEMRDYNQDFIDDLGISRADFNMKYAFTRNGEIVVGVFANEFLKPKGFYFEIIDSSLNPTDINRTIYRIPFNEFYEDEYEIDERNKYLVPLSQLKKMNRQSAALMKDNLINKPADEEIVPKVSKPYLPFEKNEPVKKEDALYSEMTIRDYIAIHTGKPVSLKSWINDLVK